MELFIQIENNQPVNHPAVKENLLDAFGKIPDDWEVFVRVEKPKVDIYKVVDPDYPEYKKVDEVWTDVWSVRDMTAEEKSVVDEFLAQQATIINAE
jgi:hypothetical protein